MCANVVWLRKGVRLTDQECIAQALRDSRPVILLYLYEDRWLADVHFHSSFLKFVNEGLEDFEKQLKAKGGKVTYRKGLIEFVLQELNSEVPIHKLFFFRNVGDAVHQEIDRALFDGSRTQGFTLVPISQNGVDHTGRKHFAKQWNEQISASQANIKNWSKANFADLKDHGSRYECAYDVRPNAQIGGESRAKSVFYTFLKSRGEYYNKELSSPVTGWSSCSRLSTYLTWGHISLKHVVQETRKVQEQYRGMPKDDRGNWLKALAAFNSRLRWRSHFSQKLHDMPHTCVENQCRLYDDMRIDGPNVESPLFQAWLLGQTGIPFLDACMRCLHKSGWLNFRMRAMVVSFAVYNLWIDWKTLAPYLAQLFLDYEPGIHYPQLQMQAGTTGINSNRMYSVSKQSKDQDKSGIFIRKYVPELKDVPTSHIHEPWKMPLGAQRKANCIIGKDYPKPIVDEKATYKMAREKMSKFNKVAKGSQEAQQILQKHGSKMNRGKKRKRDAAQPSVASFFKKSSAK